MGFGKSGGTHAPRARLSTSEKTGDGMKGLVAQSISYSADWTFDV